MKIGKKLLLSFTFICLFVLIGAVITTFYTIHINNKLSKVTEITNPSDKNVGEMVAIMWRSNYLIQRYSSETNLDKLEILDLEFKQMSRKFNEKKDFIMDITDNKEIKIKVSQAANKQDSFNKFSLKLIENRQKEIFQQTTKNERELFFIQYSIIKQLEKDVVDTVDILEEISSDLSDITSKANQESHQAVKNALMITILTTLLSLLSAGIIWSFLTKSITKPIKSLSKATSKISTGNFNINLNVEDDGSEISELSNTFNQMVTSLRNIIEESPRLKKFIKIKGKESSKVQKYIIERSTSYLIKDPSSLEAYDILLDRTNNDNTPLFITRQNPSIIKEKYGIDKSNVLWLSEEKSKGVKSSSDSNFIKKTILDFIVKNEKPIILLDRIDYLTNLHGFDKIFKLIVVVNDKIMTTNSVLLIPIDPTIFTNKQLSLLEKELNRPPQKALSLKISEELRRILQFIADRKSLNKSSTYKDIGQKFSITAPTTQKKINELNSLGLVRISKIGRNKVIEPTRDGERALVNN